MGKRLRRTSNPTRAARPPHRTIAAFINTARGRHRTRPVDVDRMARQPACARHRGHGTRRESRRTSDRERLAARRRRTSQPRHRSRTNHRTTPLSRTHLSFRLRPSPLGTTRQNRNRLSSRRRSHCSVLKQGSPASASARRPVVAHHRRRLEATHRASGADRTRGSVRFSGSSQPLSYKLCQAIAEVLDSASLDPVTLTTRAAQALSLNPPCEVLGGCW